MKILIIYAHPDPKSFCHAILEQFSKGVAEAGHYPGIKKVEHEYLHGVTMADAQTLKDYLERAYLLGKEFKTEVRKPVIV